MNMKMIAGLVACAMMTASLANAQAAGAGRNAGRAAEAIKGGGAAAGATVGAGAGAAAKAATGSAQELYAERMNGSKIMDGVVSAFKNILVTKGVSAQNAETLASAYRVSLINATNCTEKIGNSPEALANLAVVVADKAVELERNGETVEGLVAMITNPDLNKDGKISAEEKGFVAKAKASLVSIRNALVAKLAQIRKISLTQAGQDLVQLSGAQCGIVNAAVATVPAK